MAEERWRIQRISLRSTEAKTFAEFARDHDAHAHCVGCGGCLLDPDAQNSFPVWCVGCRDRIKVNLPAGATPPWAWEKNSEGAAEITQNVNNASQ